MKILVFNFGSYTHKDFLEALIKLNIQYDVVRYSFEDKNKDDFFVHRFEKYLERDNYDAVYSTNYFPILASVCYKQRIKYISWSYDNPLNVLNIEETLGFDTNYVFLFDRIQVRRFTDAGFTNVFHLPLAVNTSRLDKITSSDEDKERFSAEISFVGKLYESNLNLYMSEMDEYERGYIEGIINTQIQLYGFCLLDEMVSNDFVERINRTYKQKKPDTQFCLTKEALIYAIGSEITRRERLTLLHVLGNKHEVKLYSRENSTILSNVKYMGSCGYLEEMPKIFNLSKINLNINLKISQSGIPLRALDVMGAGGFLISSYQPEIAEYFVDGEEVVLYSSIKDAYEKVEYYLNHETERKQIAKNGYEKVKLLFCYENRIKQMFEIAQLYQ